MTVEELKHGLGPLIEKSDLIDVLKPAHAASQNRIRRTYRRTEQAEGGHFRFVAIETRHSEMRDRSDFDEEFRFH